VLSDARLDPHLEPRLIWLPSLGAVASVPAPWVAVPDLHGWSWGLSEVARRLPGHHIVLLGDLFDRGPQVPELMRQVRDLHAAGRLTLLLGNHEAMHLASLRGADGRAAGSLGGEAVSTLIAYVDRSSLARYRQDVDWSGKVALPWAALEVPGHDPLLAVHGWLPSEDDLRGRGQPGWPHWRSSFLWRRLGEPGCEVMALLPGTSGSVHGHDPSPGGRFLPGEGLGSWLLDDASAFRLQVLVQGPRGVPVMEQLRMERCGVPVLV